MPILVGALHFSSFLTDAAHECVLARLPLSVPPAGEGLHLLEAAALGVRHLEVLVGAALVADLVQVPVVGLREARGEGGEVRRPDETLGRQKKKKCAINAVRLGPNEKSRWDIPVLSYDRKHHQASCLVGGPAMLCTILHSTHTHTPTGHFSTCERERNKFGHVRWDTSSY